MKRLVGVLLVLCLALPAAGVTKLLVTVVDKKSGEPVLDLKASDFAVLVDKVDKRVEACEYGSGVIDVMLLMDSSLIGEMVRPFAVELIKQLGEKEQMAIVAYHSAADLVQDFTASRELLMGSLAEVEFGNAPRMLDALYATADSGFEHASFRRVILLVTTGVDGPSRVRTKEVIRLARRNDVSVYPVFMTGYGKSLFERLARETGGAAFSLREMSKRMRESPAERIFEVMRSHYTLTLTGNLPLGDNVKVDLPARKNRKKLLISSLPLD
ncbi:MAG: hypothetical protein GY953_05460 [bacterium]|nr:hypothetical protein [bacterium]